MERLICLNVVSFQVDFIAIILPKPPIYLEILVDITEYLVISSKLIGGFGRIRGMEENAYASNFTFC